MSREQEDMTVAPSGYRLVTPPERVRIPMREGTEETIRAIVDRAPGVRTEGGRGSGPHRLEPPIPHCYRKGLVGRWVLA